MVQLPPQKSLSAKYDRVYSSEFRTGRIRDVDPAKWTVEVEYETGGYQEGIDILVPYIHPENTEGLSILPEIGAHCVICTRIGEGSRPFVLGFRIPPANVDGVDGDDHSGARGPGVPGDMILRGRDGNFINVRRSGAVEIGADTGCRSWYFPTSSIIRHLCANYETHVSGSVVRIQTLDDPAIPDDELEQHSSHIQLEMLLQEFHDQPPLIDIKMGHVLEDEPRKLPGNNTPGEIVARILIYDQATVDSADANNLPPSPDQAVTQIRYDRRGNAEEIYVGKYSFQSDGRSIVVTGNDDVVVVGNRNERVMESYRGRTGGEHYHETGGDRTIKTEGKLTLDCRQLELIEGTARSSVLQSSRSVQVGGSSKDNVAGDRQETAGGNSTRTSVGDSVESVGGKYMRTVLHIAEPTSLLQDAIADLVQVMDGRLRRAAEMGSIEFQVGPSATPICKLKIHNDPRNPTEIGRLSITWPNGCHVIFDGVKGTFQIKGLSGEVTMDPKGQVYVGPPGGPGSGYVVTTATHPFDYMTGAPILGCAQVSVGSISPPVPGFAAPVIGPLPNVEIPDLPLP